MHGTHIFIFNLKRSLNIDQGVYINISNKKCMRSLYISLKIYICTLYFIIFSILYKKSYEYCPWSIFIVVNISRSYGSTIPAFVSDGVNSADTTESIAGLFNNFFTNIKSASVATENESEIYIKDIFNELKQNKLLNTPKSGFSFSKITLEQVLKAFEKISSSSSPGFTGIPTKILLNSLKELSPFLLNLFNSCIETGTIPDEWKYSIVLPLFKNKGKSDDCNNYRGISLLSPIAKIFETILVFFKYNTI